MSGPALVFRNPQAPERRLSEPALPPIAVKAARLYSTAPELVAYVEGLIDDLLRDVRRQDEGQR